MEDYFFDGYEIISPEDYLQLCNEGFELLHDRDIIEFLKEEATPEEGRLALRRMLGAFESTEDYEKCWFLKRLLDTEFPGDSTPVRVSEMLQQESL